MKHWIFGVFILCFLLFYFIGYFIISTDNLPHNVKKYLSHKGNTNNPLITYKNISTDPDKNENSESYPAQNETANTLLSQTGTNSPSFPSQANTLSSGTEDESVLLSSQPNSIQDISLSLPLSSPPQKSIFEGAIPSVFFSLQFINEQILPYEAEFQSISIGGLSALSYEPDSKTFFAVSDDKGKHGPPRFYKLSLSNTDNKYQIRVSDQVFLFHPSGRHFTNLDAEGISYFPNKNQIFISSEGTQKPNLLIPPGIFIFNMQGQWQASWKVSTLFWPENINELGKWGTQDNKAFEAMSINSYRDHLWVSTESALYQDILPDEHARNRQYIRFNQFNLKDNTMIKQVVYPAVSQIRVNQFTGFNGVTDFLSLGDQKLLVVERAYLKDSSTPDNRKTDVNSIRLFLTDCSSATDVSEHPSLKNKEFTTCGKRQLVDLSDIIVGTVDNIEGITIGPEVSNGSYLMVLVSDNNFSNLQKTQFLFFHYTPE